MQMSSVPTYPVKFQASSGHTANAQITDNTNTGTFQFDTDGYVQVSTGKAATLNAAPTKSSSTSTTMHLNGAGIMKVLTDLSASAASTTPAVSVDAGILEVYGTTGKLPPVATSVTSGGKLQLGDASTPVVAAGAIPGAFDVASGGMVAVAAGVTAPNNVLGGAVTFHSGTILILGGGATWRQNMTISS